MPEGMPVPLGYDVALGRDTVAAMCTSVSACRVEVQVLDGGQPVYSYLIGVE